MCGGPFRAVTSVLPRARMRSRNVDPKFFSVSMGRNGNAVSSGVFANEGRWEDEMRRMNLLMTSAGTMALALTFSSNAIPQSAPALGETSIRPMEITCQDLTSASVEERSGMIYFIAGYSAAIQQGG